MYSLAAKVAALASYTLREWKWKLVPEILEKFLSFVAFSAWLRR
jgi:hypothetical protein